MKRFDLKIRDECRIASLGWALLFVFSIPLQVGAIPASCETLFMRSGSSSSVSLAVLGELADLWIEVRRRDDSSLERQFYGKVSDLAYRYQMSQGRLIALISQHLGNTKTASRADGQKSDERDLARRQLNQLRHPQIPEIERNLVYTEPTNNREKPELSAEPLGLSHFHGTVYSKAEFLARKWWKAIFRKQDSVGHLGNGGSAWTSEGRFFALRNGPRYLTGTAKNSRSSGLLDFQPTRIFDYLHRKWLDYHPEQGFLSETDPLFAEFNNGVTHIVDLETGGNLGRYPGIPVQEPRYTLRRNYVILREVGDQHQAFDTLVLFHNSAGKIPLGRRVHISLDGSRLAYLDANHFLHVIDLASGADVALPPSWGEASLAELDAKGIGGDVYLTNTWTESSGPNQVRRLNLQTLQVYKGIRQDWETPWVRHFNSEFHIEDRGSYRILRMKMPSGENHEIRDLDDNQIVFSPENPVLYLKDSRFFSTTAFDMQTGGEVELPSHIIGATRSGVALGLRLRRVSDTESVPRLQIYDNAGKDLYPGTDFALDDSMKVFGRSAKDIVGTAYSTKYDHVLLVTLKWWRNEKVFLLNLVPNREGQLVLKALPYTKLKAMPGISADRWTAVNSQGETEVFEIGD